MVDHRTKVIDCTTVSFPTFVFVAVFSTPSIPNCLSPSKKHVFFRKPCSMLSHQYMF